MYNVIKSCSSVAPDQFVCLVKDGICTRIEYNTNITEKQITFDPTEDGDVPKTDTLYQYDCYYLDLSDKDYRDVIDKMIKLKYSPSKESQLQREALIATEMSTEFNDYNDYVETVIQLVKSKFGITK